MRPLPKKLSKLFDHVAKTPSDINEHLPLLAKIGEQCEHITEFGMRGALGSTVAFLTAQPKKLVSWDIDPRACQSGTVRAISELLWTDETNRTHWEVRCGNTLEIVIEPTDLLFIDTLHTAAQLKAELVRHADPIERKVSKYLAFHDTVTFGHRGEDGSIPGLRDVIKWFQRKHAFPLWELLADEKNNNGLVILERVRT